MTKIRSSDASGIDDRRGGGGGGGGGLGGGGLGSVLGGGGLKAGGGVLGIVVLLAAIFLPKLLGGSASQAVNPGNGGVGRRNAAACTTDLEQTVCGAVKDVQQYWTAALPKFFSKQYASTKLAFFSGSTSTGCGSASSRMGPFYCPADRLVYIDLDFMQQLERQLIGQTNDLAEQYIVAHEFGHHIQNLLGTSAKVDAQRNGGAASKYSVGLELQADCYAGAWAGDANARGQLDSTTEVNEATAAARGVGDDAIQGAGADASTFTHGTSEQRQRWFLKGYQSQDPTQCAGTFAEEGVSA